MPVDRGNTTEVRRYSTHASGGYMLELRGLSTHAIGGIFMLEVRLYTVVHMPVEDTC